MLSVKPQRLEDGLVTSTALVRSKFLAAAGAGLFGIATRLVLPESARANHDPAPQGCFGFGVCHCCSGSTCCVSGCNYPGGHSDGCPNGGQCWNTCVGNLMYQCCDWHYGTSSHCICRGFVSACPPP